MDATVQNPHPQDRRARRDRLQKCFIGWHWIRTGIGMALPRDSIYLSVDALPEPLERVRVRKVPTGIADLDSIVDGGFPSGSTILLWGDIGAGMQEYVYTAGSKTALVNERPEARLYYLGDRCDDSDLPTTVCYVKFSRSMVIILPDHVTTIKGLQRVAKRWNGLVYLMLPRGILERRHESLLMDSTDGCLVFEWRTSARSSTRQRYMYLEKFTGVLPHLPRDKIARFPTMVSSNHGLVVVYMERIS